MSTLVARPLTADAFGPFGEIIEVAGAFKTINAGKCRRYHDLARADVVEGSVGVNLFVSDVRPLPYMCDMVERHPQGSQCFLPMDGSAYLVIVAPDEDGRPGPIQAFLARPDQGVSYRRNTWHGVLAPVSGGGLFAVVDRIGEGPNLEEYTLPAPVTVTIED